ncbi:MAG: 3D domain-containing protein [Armatimonadota bacterium]|nr:3D domain-containing protein [Armatimonadota bacterium]
MPFNRNMVALSTTFVLVTAGLLFRHGASVDAANITTNPEGALLVPHASQGSAGGSALSSFITRTGVAIRSGTDSIANFTGSTKVQTIKEHVEYPVATHFTRTFRLLPGHRWEAPGQGTPGIREYTVRVSTLNGRVVSRTVLSSRWSRQPVDKIVAVGVSPFTVSRSFDGLSRPFTMRASKYDMFLRDRGAGGPGNGICCTGVRARRGIVAVDPRVIPFGTHLYVEGYGYCVAMDRGGAIKGNRIDLCVENPAEANAYGIRPVRVCIAH